MYLYAILLHNMHKNVKTNVTRGDLSPIEPKKVYSLAETATALDVDRRVLRKELSDQEGGRLEFFKVGEQYKILGENIHKFAGSVTHTGEEHKNGQ